MLDIFGFAPQHSAIARDVTFTQDSSAAEDAISRKGFADVIRSSELFWLTYCMEASKISGEDSDAFSVSLDDRVVTISGKEHIIPKIQRVVEEIRGFFIKGLDEKKDFSFLAISLTMDVFLKEAADPVILFVNQNFDSQILSLAA